MPEDQSRDGIVNSWQVARDIYRLDGPIPRLFYEYKPDRLDQWRIERGNALGTTNHENVKMMLRCDPYNLAWADSTQNPSSQSHKLILIKRGKADVFDGTSSITIITESVKILLMERMLEFDYMEMVQLLKMLSQPGETRGSAGWLYEAFCLNQLRKQSLTLTLFPMIKGKRTDSRYSSTHDCRPNGSTHKVKVSQFRWKIYDHINEFAVEEKIIYKPISRNEEAIDAFFILDHVLYMLQFTLGKTHTVGTPSFDKLKGVPSSKDRRHVFVTRGSNKLQVSSKGFNCSLPPFTAILWPREL